MAKRDRSVRATGAKPEGKEPKGAVAVIEPEASEEPEEQTSKETAGEAEKKAKQEDENVVISKAELEELRKRAEAKRGPGTGHKWTEEQRAALSAKLKEVWKDRPGSMKGRQHTEEAKAKMREGLRKAWAQKNRDLGRTQLRKHLIQAIRYACVDLGLVIEGKEHREANRAAMLGKVSEVVQANPPLETLAGLTEKQALEIVIQLQVESEAFREAAKPTEVEEPQAIAS